MNTKIKMRLFSFLLCVVMLVGLMPTTAFAATTYTVTFKAGGGSGTMDPVTVEAGEYILPECTFSNEGYEFKAWAYNSNVGEQLQPGTKITIRGNIRLYAVWQAKSYTITAVSEDESKGTVTGGGTYEYSEQALLKATPKEGYVFEGWYEDGLRVTGSSSQQFFFVSGDATYTAKFTKADDIITAANAVIDEPVAGAKPDMTPEVPEADKDKYTVTFYKWYDSSYNEMSDEDTFEGDKEYELRVVFEAKEGYKFEGTTFKVNDKATEDFTDENPYSVTRRKIKFQVPAAASYPVTIENGKINIYGGTSNGNYGPGSIVAIVANAPESGKQFKEWTATDGVSFVDATAAETSFTMPAKPVTITAVYENVSEYTKKGNIDAVTATATIDPALGATTSAVSFTITEPTDAAAKGVKLLGSSWYKKDASSIYGWTQCSNGVDTFEEGTYRLEVQLRSESNDAKEYHAMSGETTFTVNSVQWSGKEQFRDYYASSGYGYRFFVSPEFTLGGKTLDSIAVTTPPTKTVYREGEDFDPAGMVVTATYTDSTTAPVLLYTVTDGTAMAADKASVTISYTEGGVTKTTTQTITVAKEYNVTVNGGTGNGKYVAGEEVTISAFVSGGRKFKEWQGTEGLTFTSGDKNSQAATFTMPAHDVTLTAVTGPAEYYVSVSGGSGTGMYEASAIVTIVADAPEAGKQFKEWSVGDGKVLRFAEGDITSSTAKFVMPGEAVRISATYEDIPATTYTVSFAANGGTGTMTDVTGISGEYTLPENSFTAPDGKQFKAWSVGGAEKAVGDKITVTADTTVTAVWEDITPETHTVSFDTKGGSAVEPQTIEEGGKVTKPADPVKEGFDFVGWTYTEKDWNFDNTVTGDMTLVAVWKEKEVTPPGGDQDPVYGIMVNNGAAYAGAGAEITAAEEGTKITLKADAAPEGKEFDKWVVNNGTITLADATKAETTFDMPAERVQVTATYKDKTVTPPADNNDADDSQPSEPKAPAQNTESQLDTVPKTGDDSNIFMWIMLLMLGACGIVGIGIYKKRSIV